MSMPLNSNGAPSRGSRTGRRGWTLGGDERGAVTVTVALAITALLAMLALSIDLGALFNARSEAQRAADSAALAGASAFLEYQQSQARQAAESRAVEFATENTIRNQNIEAGEVSVSIDLDSSTVHARVRREAVPTWFAGLLGIDAVNVAAEATAWAGAAGAAQCVKPFAVPDMWEETTDDLNGNRIWDEGERWSYDPDSGDRYAGYSGPGSGGSETGYGSGWRNGEVDGLGRRYDRDYGRRITVKVTSPRDAFVPSFFLPWVLPSDGDQAECGSRPGGGNNGGGNNGGGNNGGGNSGGGGGDGGGGDGEAGDPPGPGKNKSPGWLEWWKKRGELGRGNSGGPPGGGSNPPGGGGSGGGGVERDDGDGRGAARYRRNICTCNSSTIDLDTEYMIEPGNMVGPTYQGVQNLIDLDPDAFWDERTNSVISDYGMDSPRVVTVALFDPGEITNPGRQYLRFNNFARIFIEEQPTRQDAVTGRFLFYVPGLRGRTGNTTGSLVRVLQLIR